MALSRWRRLFLCAAILGCFGALRSTPAVAQEDVATVNGWTISDEHGFCSASKDFPGGVSFRVEHESGTDRTTLIVSNPLWTSISVGQRTTVDLRFSNGRHYEAVPAYGIPGESGSAGSVALSMTLRGPDFQSDFAAAAAVVVTFRGVRSGSLSLSGTREVAARLLVCAEQSLRRFLPPPFVVAAPATASEQLPPGTTPPIQRTGTITSDDYPAAAIRAAEQGRTGIMLSVTATGMVSACAIVETSGSAILDAASCTLAYRRFRYAPARDASGNPIAGQVTRQIEWRLPAWLRAR